MTKTELEARARQDCLHCASDIPVRHRPETNEYVHDIRIPAISGFAHTICRANQLRRAFDESV